MVSARILLPSAALFAASIPAAQAGVSVIGSSLARTCYELADSPRTPAPRDIARCDQALDEPGINHHDIVATYVNRGILKLRRGQVAPAIADFDAAIRLDPEQPEAYLNKGAALLRRNDAAGAVPLFAAALQHRTIRPELAHFGRAVAQEHLGNAAEAYRDYRRASELAPGWAEPQTELQRFRVTRRQ